MSKPKAGNYSLSVDAGFASDIVQYAEALELLGMKSMNSKPIAKIGLTRFFF